MKFPLLSSSVVVAILAGLFATTPLLAAPITVNNASFEDPVQAPEAWTNTFPDWPGRFANSGSGNGESFDEYITGFAADGTQHLGMQNQAYHFQDTGVPFEPNSRYKLTVAIGNRAGGTNEGVSGWGITNLEPPSDDSTDLPGLLVSDPFLNATVQTGEADLLTGDSTFIDGTPSEYETGAVTPIGNVYIVIGVISGGRSHFDNIRLDVIDLTLDTDNDGLPDYWEDENGLDKNDNTGVNGASGDPDGDLVGNLTEFNNLSDPQNPDTDGDGLTDTVETNTGVFLGSGNTGSNPILVDTDNDSISDPDEVNGTFGNVTNPNLRDSDGDGYSDPSENAAGTDPNSAASNPTVMTASQLGYNFVGGRGAAVPNSNGGYIQVGRIVTGPPVAGVSAQSGWNNLNGAAATRTTTTLDDGSASSALLTWSSANTWSISAVIDNIPFLNNKPKDGNSALMQGYLDNNPSIEIEGVPYPTYDLIVYFDSDDPATRVANYTANGESKPGIVNSGSNWNPLTGAGSFTQGFATGDAANYVIFHGLSDVDLSISAQGTSGPGSIQGIQIVNATLDTDGGGIPDSTELRLGLNPLVAGDDTADGDSDGANNLIEIGLETDPSNADTDGDGVDDGDEVTNGTDPLDADSDDDGLLDGEEVTAGTNPNLADTDSDGLSDGDEVKVYGSDPLDTDSDDDTLSDGDEVLVYGSNPTSNESDGDTLLDQDEVNIHGTDPSRADTDRDGLDDNVELVGPTDPLDPDSDDDSLEDGYEINISFTDPLDIASPGVVAQAIGLNFVSDQAPAGALGVDEIAGHPDYLQKNWNSTFPMFAGTQFGSEFDVETPFTGIFTDSNGVPLDEFGDGSGFPIVTALWESNTRFSGMNGTANANSKLMNGYLDAGGPIGPTSISIAALPYAFCDVVVYVGSAENDRNGRVVLLDGSFSELGQSGYNSSARQPAGESFQAEDYVVSTDTTGLAFPDATVVVFKSVAVGGLGELIIENHLEGGNTGIFGIQFVNSSEPSADLALTDVSLTGPSSLQITWSGGDGSNNIETSINGQSWTNAATGVASPATIVVDPVGTPTLLVRVTEP